ncbi:hypothetical protein WA158_000853 [Blastocystis sp. Blastoise]
MKKVTVGAIQFTCSDDYDENIRHASSLIQEAVSKGAQIVLLPELFTNIYFCKDRDVKYFELAEEVPDSKTIKYFQKLAKELKVVLPISFFEKSNQVYYNSLAVIDADGTLIGIYRKTHIPGAPGYREKFYFAPGDTGFKVFHTQYANIGIGICWDQWFPESARILAIGGAELIFYPTCLGSSIQHPEVDYRTRWRRVMQGHAVANIIPVIAANRIGRETSPLCTMDFFGTSFICNEIGDILEDAVDKNDCVIVHEFNLTEINSLRDEMGQFRDRRPNLYTSLTTLDGRNEYC